MKIVIANCVGIDSDGWQIIPYPSRWTTSAKGYSDAFTYYPKDLGYLSALLKKETSHDVKLLDACLSRYDKETYAKVIACEKPDWLVIESSTRTIKEDLWVAQKVKETCGAKTMMTGQHPSAFAKETAEECDVVIKGEFLLPALEFFNDGAKAEHNSIIEFSKSQLINVGRLPFPEDEDISRYDYALKADPICQYREIQLYTSRGCPYRCVYCVAAHTYYGGPDWRPREPDDIIAEMRYLYEKYPDCEGMFFDDEIHNADIKRIKRLAKAIIDAGLHDKKYNAMCAYHTFDREALELMKRAGYYLVRVGIETASDQVAEGLQLKGKHRPEKLMVFLENAKDIGLEVYGTFTVGGPGANPKEDRRTIALMKDLIENDLLSDCQISICTPQPGAPFYDIAVRQGAISQSSWSDYDGGVQSVVDFPGYPGKAVTEIRQEALCAYDEARAVRDKGRFEHNWKTETKKVGRDPERILLFRSSRDWILNLALNGVRELWPASEIAMLCHENLIGAYGKQFPWLMLIPYRKDGFLSVEGMAGETENAVLSFNADTAFIPTNVYHSRGYDNVEQIVRYTGVRSAFFINSAGKLKPVKGAIL